MPVPKIQFLENTGRILKITCNRERVGLLLTEIWETCSTDQRHETGRLKHMPTRTKEDVVTVECGWNGRLAKPQRPETNISFNTPDIQRNGSYKSFTEFLVGSIFCLPTRLLSITISFSCIYISQGSVATQLKCGGIVNNHFISNCLQNASVKKFWKSVNIWRRYRQSQSGTFLGHSVHIFSTQEQKHEGRLPSSFWCL